VPRQGRMRCPFPRRPLRGRDALSKCAGGAFVAKVGHEVLSKMPGGHLVARVGEKSMISTWSKLVCDLDAVAVGD